MTTHLFRLYTAAEARQTILKRSPVGEVKPTPTLAKGIERVFRESLSLEAAVSRILADVRKRGDAAVLDWTEKIDGVRLPGLLVPPADIEAAYTGIPAELRDALHWRRAHPCLSSKRPSASWLDGGARAVPWNFQIVRPLEQVGVYAPGRTAPLPQHAAHGRRYTARVAGVEQVIVTRPAAATAREANCAGAAGRSQGGRGGYGLPYRRSAGGWSHGLRDRVAAKGG